MKSQKLAIALSVVAILAAATAVYAASYVLNSGEYIGLTGSNNGRLVFTETGALDSIQVRDGYFHFGPGSAMVVSQTIESPQWLNPSGSTQGWMSLIDGVLEIYNESADGATIALCPQVGTGFACLYYGDDLDKAKLFLASPVAGYEVNFADNYIVKSGKLVTSTAIAARAYNNANISIPNATNTALTFNTESFDNDAIHGTTNTSRLTAKTAGIYSIMGGGAFASNATGARSLGIRLNGATYIASVSVPSAGATVYTNLTVSAMFYLNANEYVEITAYQSSGGNLNVVYVNNYSPWGAMSRMP